ncbi:MAG: VOC family protein [Pseudomonadota bacterium]
MNDFSGIGAIRSLDYVIILCDDLARMRTFYADLFGFELEHERPGHSASFRVGTLYLHLRQRGRGYDGLQGPEGSASVQLSFRVPPADVDLAYETLKAKQIEVIEGPTNQDWLHRTLFFKDPEGNILEIFTDIHPNEAAASPSGVHEIIGA